MFPFNYHFVKTRENFNCAVCQLDSSTKTIKPFFFLSLSKVDHAAHLDNPL